MRWGLIGLLVFGLQDQDSLRLEREFGDRALIISVHPKNPAAGDLIRCTVTVCPKGQESRPFEISRGTAMVDSSRIYQLQPLPKGAYGFSTLAEKEGRLKIDIDVDIEEDRFEASAAFDLNVGPARLARVDVKDAKQVMSEIGRLWAELHRQIEEHRDLDRSLIAKIQELRAAIPNLTPRKFPNRKPEFVTMAEEFGRDLDALKTSKDFRKEFRRIDLFSCTRCHLVFRWGSVPDIKRFPDLVDESVKK